MKSRLARAAFLIALFTIVLAGCGWFGEDDVLDIAGDGSLVVTIADLPDGITKITVNVTGIDMDPVSAEFTGDPANSDPLIIPEGTGRNWTVVVDTDNATPVTQYTAGGTADIVGGEITEVTASLLISGTKLVVIDDANERIVQVDDIGGSGWTAFDTSYSWWGMIDLEIGPDAKIYVTDGEMTSIHVLDDIADDTPTIVSGLESLAPEQIGIDHRNSLIFFSVGLTGLHSVPLVGGTPTDYSDVLASYFGEDISGVAIKGVAVNDSGVVAIVYAVGTDLRSLTLNPAGTGSVIDDEAVYAVDFGMEAPFYNDRADIIAKRDAYYVLLFRDDNTGPVVKLDSALVVQDSYGSLYDGETSGPDTLYGPALFVGHRNPQIQFIDDSAVDVDRLVEIEDILGTGRTDFGDTGSGVGQFEFFEPTPLPPPPPQ